MRNQLKTRFWRNAYESLPPTVRVQYYDDIVRAERWELALGAAVDVMSAAKNAVARLFQVPRERHGH